MMPPDVQTRVEADLDNSRVFITLVSSGGYEARVAVYTVHDLDRFLPAEPRVQTLSTQQVQASIDAGRIGDTNPSN